jgi:DNA-directed RNA polymerase specialized sigma24 family protein
MSLLRCVAATVTQPGGRRSAVFLCIGALRAIILICRDEREAIECELHPTGHASLPPVSNRRTDRALAYLHQAVVTRSRSALRHRVAAGKSLTAPAPGTPGASPAGLAELQRSALISALQTLAPRQREALVLTYYAGLPQAQIASAMRISKGAVKSHTTQAMSSLRAELHTTNR